MSVITVRRIFGDGKNMDDVQSTSPKYQLMPAMDPVEYAALKQNIKEHGVKVAVEYDEDGEILDGHHRVAICAELDIYNFPKIIRSGLSEQEKRSHVRSLNLTRRHLTRQQRQRLIAEQLRDTPTISDRAIAARLGVSHHTVKTSRKNLERRGQIAHVEKRTDTLGRSQPAKKQRVTYVDDSPEGRTATVMRAREIREQNGKTSHQIGTKKATKEEQGLQLHETPREAVLALVAVEKFQTDVRDTAVGRGAIGRVLENFGHAVFPSDIHDYGYVTADGIPTLQIDFLKMQPDGVDADFMINPPFGDVINSFIAHVLREFKPPKLAALMNLNALCGFDDDDRNFWMDAHPPSRIYVFKRRLPMMHRDGWDGKKATSQMNCMWCVWERGQDGSFPDLPPLMFRIDWMAHIDEKCADWQGSVHRKFLEQTAIAPGEASQVKDNQKGVVA